MCRGASTCAGILIWSREFAKSGELFNMAQILHENDFMIRRLLWLIFQLVFPWG